MVIMVLKLKKEDEKINKFIKLDKYDQV